MVESAKRITAAFLLAGALAGCTNQQAVQTQQRVTRETTQSFNAVNGVLKKVDAKDAALKVQVTAAMAEQAGANVFRIGTDVRAGVVTLSGTVPNDQVEQTVIRAAAGVSGVKRVDNHLTISS
jgi:osmotically-inducible protein OsmY